MSNNKKDLSIYDFGKICRTCLTEGEMKPLYEECSSDVCLIEMLMTCTFIQFAENDGLPYQICLQCFTNITQAYNFAKKCEETDKILRKCINQFQSKLKGKEKNENKLNTKILRQTRLKRQQEIEIETQIILNEKNKSDTVIKTELDLGTDISEIKYDTIKNETIKSDNDYDSYVSYESSDDLDKKELKNEPNGGAGDTKNNIKKKLRYKIKSQPPYECKKCFEKFPNFQLLKLHRKEVKHPPNSYNRKVCKICSKSIGYSRMNQHMRVHTLEKPYCCEICGARFSISSNLRRHTLSRHSAEKPYKCIDCHKGFTRLALLKDHQRLHTGERPFVCNFCGKAFAQSAGFRTHLFIHAKKGETTGQITGKEHECKNCQRCFATKTLLKAHQLIHGEKRFLCSDCGRGFHSMILLKSHSKVHTGVKPYNCSTCDKSFSHIGSLKSHTLIHTGQKPFICNVCNRGFTQRNHLKYHLRTHSGERPYSCSVCGKTFALNGNLTVHMRTHTGETPYLCPVCGKGFHDSSSMKKHKKGHTSSVDITVI